MEGRVWLSMASVESELCACVRETETETQRERREGGRECARADPLAARGLGSQGNTWLEAGPVPSHRNGQLPGLQLTPFPICEFSSPAQFLLPVCV